MFPCRLFIFSIIIHSFIRIVHSASAYNIKNCIDIRPRNRPNGECISQSRKWRCATSQACGNTYGSCIGGSPKALETHVLVIIVVIVVIFSTILSGYGCYWRAQRKRRMRAHFAQQIQSISAPNQRQDMYYISPGFSTYVEPPIKEPPPAYDQLVKQTPSN